MQAMIQVVQPSGILNGPYSNQLRQEIDDIVETGVKTILVDLAEVTFIDSSGLGALILAFKSARTAGSRLCFCSVGDQARMLFEITGTDQVFSIYANRDEFERSLLRTADACS